MQIDLNKILKNRGKVVKNQSLNLNLINAIHDKTKYMNIFIQKKKTYK